MESGNASRAWCAASIDAFRTAPTQEVLGTLAKNSSFSMLETQRDAWLAQIHFLREHLRGLNGALFFEFSIPRMGRRVDVVLLIGGVVFVIEFKVGATTFDGSAIDQVWDYALDLKNFHEASHHLTIVPVLVVPDALQPRVLELGPRPHIGRRQRSSKRRVRYMHNTLSKRSRVMTRARKTLP